MADRKVYRSTLTESQRNLFSEGTNFYGFDSKYGRYKNYTGRIASPFRELTIGRSMSSGPKAKNPWSISQFPDARNMELPKDYSGSGKHSTKNGLKTKNSWSAFGFGKSETIKLKNFKELALQMAIAAHQVSIAAEHYRFVLAQRALKIFQESFELKRFNSARTVRWKLNTEWTRKKRKRKGTWPGAGKLMQETNELYKSLEYIPRINAFTSGVRANAPYAGIHNDPRPGETYGNGFGGIFSPAKAVTRRQFMGHSSLLDDFINAYERAYLFDTVFRKPS